MNEDEMLTKANRHPLRPRPSQRAPRVGTTPVLPSPIAILAPGRRTAEEAERAEKRQARKNLFE